MINLMHASGPEKIILQPLDMLRDYAKTYIGVILTPCQSKIFLKLEHANIVRFFVALRES